MAYAVQEHTDAAAFDRLVNFQESSAWEVSHRRDHAATADEPEVSRFRDKVTHSREHAPKGISH